jgi:hypothetical protein
MDESAGLIIRVRVDPPEHEAESRILLGNLYE